MKVFLRILIFIYFFRCGSIEYSFAQVNDEINYDESKVPQYILPDPLLMQDGQKIKTVDEWQQKRRPEILNLFKSQVYGIAPERPDYMRFEVVSEDKNVFNGKATRKQVSIFFSRNSQRPRMDILMYIPNKQASPVPAFFGLNFYGNQAVYPDPGIKLTDQWVSDRFGVNNKAVEESRGVDRGAWPVEAILDRGYALITAYYGDLNPDYNEGYEDGVIGFYPRTKENDSTRWEAVSAWAWGLSRGMDYLETDRDIDASKVSLIGHSRLGKAALWAAAQDERFAMVVSNSSGAMGAAISRRRFGETVYQINKSFPWWFADNFKKYNNREDALPVDQHELIALIAPRPIYVQSSTLDRWADPYGQFLACKFATPVYNLFGVRGITIDDMPKENEPDMGGRIGFHNRAGIHMVTLYDWERYMDFADKYLR